MLSFLVLHFTLEIFALVPPRTLKAWVTVPGEKILALVSSTF